MLKKKTQCLKMLNNRNEKYAVQSLIVHSRRMFSLSVPIAHQSIWYKIVYTAHRHNALFSVRFLLQDVKNFHYSMSPLCIDAAQQMLCTLRLNSISTLPNWVTALPVLFSWKLFFIKSVQLKSMPRAWWCYRVNMLSYNDEKWGKWNGLVVLSLFLAW